MNHRCSSKELVAWQARWPNFRASTVLGESGALPFGSQFLSIEDGSLADVALLIRNVIEGAENGVFSATYFESRAQLTLTYEVAKSMLRRRLKWSAAEQATHFLVVRKAGNAVAAVLVKTLKAGGNKQLLIDKVVVDRAERGHSIGHCLMDYLVASQPANTLISMCSTSSAHAMKKIARSIGMKNLQKAHIAGGVRQPHYFGLTK